jgi:hypothetical protein
MMHRSFVIALLAIISVLVPSKPAAAQTATGPPCAAHREVLAFLQQVVGERLIGSGLSSDGFLLEVYASQTGTWTIVVTAPTGTSCVVTQGRAWEAPSERPVGGSKAAPDPIRTAPGSGVAADR